MEDDKPPFDYRKWLVEADHKASQAYDKALLTLAGGALGISFAFLKDLVASPSVREEGSSLELRHRFGSPFRDVSIQDLTPFIHWEISPSFVARRLRTPVKRWLQRW